MTNMLVMKFGGTSVGDPIAIRRVAGIIASRRELRPVVVVSATAKTTDELVRLSQTAGSGDRAGADNLIEWIAQKHQRILEDLGLAGDSHLPHLVEEVGWELRRVAEALEHRGEVTRDLADDCLSWGEYLSANILAAYLRLQNIPGIWVDARSIMVTNDRFGRARALYVESRQRVQSLLVPEIQRGCVPVVQGFIGRELEGRTTTFGRGGSDLSATVLGTLVDAEKVEIWTDVDGIMTADPSLVRGVRRIRRMTFEEAAELAYFGAKVLHPATLLPAVEKGIPVEVLNSMRPGEAGTSIVRSGVPDSRETPVKSIAYKEGLSVVNIRSSRMLMAYGFLATIFEIFNRFETPVDLVSTSEVSVSVTVDSLEHIDSICAELSEFAEVEVLSDQAIVSLVGENLNREPGAPAAVFSELAGVRINLIAQGGSRINLSFVISESDLPEVINRLHNRFFSGSLDESVFAPPREEEA
jgi:aspartate kinase